MRALLAVLVTAASLTILPAAAKANCLLCGVVGLMIGAATSSDGAVAGVSPNVIYVLPNISGRLPVEERLAVKFAASKVYHFDSTEEDRKATARQNSHWGNYLAGKNVSVAEIFKATVPSFERFELLEVMRIIDPADPSKARFWFAYVEKDKLAPPNK